MNKIFFKVKKKQIYIFFSFLFIYLTFFSTTFLIAKTYTVENVEIIEPFDLNFKKNNVIDNAFKSAFKRIISRIVSSKDIEKVDLQNINIIRPMIHSFSIKNEQFINNNYSATFEVKFNKKNILNFLNAQNIKSSIPKKSEILFIPVFIELDKNELLLFSESIFYKNWNKISYDSFLISYLMPNEDLEDFSVIKKNLPNIENYNFKEILSKYDNKDYIISIFFKQGTSLKVLSKIYFNNKFLIRKSNFPISNYLTEIKSDQIIKSLKILYEDKWKNENEINTSIKLPLTISLKSKNITVIKKFERELSQSEFVYDYSIQMISNENTIYKIIYNNTPDRFLNNFKNKSFKIDTSKKIWIIE